MIDYEPLNFTSTIWYLSYDNFCCNVMFLNISSHGSDKPQCLLAVDVCLSHLISALLGDVATSL